MCLILVVGALLLTSCETVPVEKTPHVHTEVIDEAVAPTCTDTGLTKGKHCSVCNEVIVKRQVVKALGHTEVIDEAVAPTCAAKGLSRGSHCSVCGEVIVRQNSIKKLEHTVVTEAFVAPTCTATGLTSGKHCSVCNEVIVEREVLDALGHRETIDKAVAPTCDKTGLTEGKSCSVCKAVIVKQETVDALGHTEAIDNAVAPTCTNSGLTEGKHCSVCSEVIVPQTVVAPNGHGYGAWNVTEAPTEDKNGSQNRQCTVCGNIETEVIPSLKHDHSRWGTITIEGVAPTCISSGLTEGKKCADCGTITVPQQVIPATGHSYESVVTPPTCTDRGYTTHTCHCGATKTDSYVAKLGHAEVIDEAVAPTCDNAGLTEGKHCSRCDTVLIEQVTLAALGHNYVFMQVPDEDGVYGYVCTKCYGVDRYVRYVTYEEFDDENDGVDADEIRAAHDFANTYGIPVQGKAGATYHIGVLDKTIKIQTDTDWNGATFIIDDRDIRWDDKTLRNVQVFTVAPNTAAKSVSVPTALKNNGLKKGQTNIGMTFSEPCMLKIENSGELIYKRIGVNATSGAYKNEMILVDKNGNVDPSTPIQYDYSSITTIIAYSINEKAIRVGNATFTTIAPNPREQDANYENNNTSFFNRGLCVERSNTTIYDVEHIVENEMMTIEIDRNGDGVIDKWGADKSYGVTYNGFYNFNSAYNVTMQDCIVEGHQAYSFWQDLNGVSTRNEVGNYDITASRCVNLNFIRVTQYENEETGEVITNRFMYHGIMGTNWCRNMVLDGCYLDRFDSHQGMHNATLKNSTFGFGILAIGGGKLHVENVKRISGSGFIHLRMDYNSYFDGDVEIINCEMSSEVGFIVEGNWLEHHCGLPNHMTNSLVIDGLTVDRNKICLYSIRGAAVETLTNATNPLILPTYVEVNGVKKPNGSTVGVEKSAYNDAFMQIPLEIHVHKWNEGEIVESSSTASCKTNKIIYTCTDPDCGLTMESIVGSSTPHTTLTHSISSEGYITYTCSTCGCSYTPSFSYVNDGSDYNAIEGSSNATRGYVTASGTDNPVINANGEYELLKANSDSATQMELWIPSKTYSLNELSSENNAIGFFSFKINAYTDSSIQMKFVDMMANSGDNRWKEGGCITEDFFKVSSPVTSGTFIKKTQVTISGWDWSKKIDITDNSDNFTGWIDVKIMLELDSATDKVTAHYYIDGTYVGSASRTITTLNNTLSAVYISGKNTEKGTGIKLDDVAFGCFFGKRV